MTIAGAYLTSDGVVLGADSTTTISDEQGNTIQLLNHAQKVFEIGENSRFGFCTFGDGTVGTLSHRTISALLADSLGGEPGSTVEEVAARLIDVITQEAERFPGRAPIRGLGYFVGGVNPDRTPACARVEFRPAAPGASPSIAVQVKTVAIGSAAFDGAPEYFVRVFRGYAPGLREAIGARLKEKLAKLSQLPADFDSAFVEAVNEVSPAFTSHGYADLPLREAIDYIHTWLTVTTKAMKFRYGPAVCGGPVEVAYISTDRVFRWARHKSFESAIREHERHSP